MDYLADLYQRAWDQRDKRLDGYLLVDSLALNVALVSAYVFLVTVVGPRFMKDREPYNPKLLMQAYNLFQVVFCSYFVIEGGRRAWFSHYSWVCQPVETDSDPNSSGMFVAYATWMYFLNKYSDFADTFFFIAKKKFNQVTVLHVYHHAIMPLYSYMHVRWSPGGHEILAGYINFGVHVVMYSYYFLSALGPWMQPYLWWKKYLTAMQLVQFVFCFGHSLIVVLGLVECGYPRISCLLSMVFLHVPFFVMFMQFFYKTYSLKSSIKRAAAKTQCVPAANGHHHEHNGHHVSNGHTAKKEE